MPSWYKLHTPLLWFWRSSTHLMLRCVALNLTPQLRTIVLYPTQRLHCALKIHTPPMPSNFCVVPGCDISFQLALYVPSNAAVVITVGPATVADGVAKAQLTASVHILTPSTAPAPQEFSE